jgi:hypothetical protein
LRLSGIGHICVMRLRRLTTGGLGVFAALCLGVTACAGSSGTSGTGSSGSSSAPGTATSAPAAGEALTELTAAAQKLNDDTVTVTVSSNGLKSTGNLDPASDKASSTMTFTGQGTSSTIDVRAVEEDVYLKATGMPNVDPTKWLHIDVARLAGTSFDLLPEGDAAGASRFVENMADVESTGDGTYRGTLDLTKVSGNTGVSIDVLGGKGEAVPFTATVDDQDRLTGLTIDLSSIDPQLGTVTTTYSGFGSPVTVAAPAAAETVEAPESVLRLLGVK